MSVCSGQLWNRGQLCQTLKWAFPELCLHFIFKTVVVRLTISCKKWKPVQTLKKEKKRFTTAASGLLMEILKNTLIKRHFSTEGTGVHSVAGTFLAIAIKFPPHSFCFQHWMMPWLVPGSISLDHQNKQFHVFLQYHGAAEFRPFILTLKTTLIKVWRQ